MLLQDTATQQHKSNMPMHCQMSVLKRMSCVIKAQRKNMAIIVKSCVMKMRLSVPVPSHMRIYAQQNVMDHDRNAKEVQRVDIRICTMEYRPLCCKGNDYGNPSLAEGDGVLDPAENQLMLNVHGLVTQPQKKMHYVARERVKILYANVITN
eukprot:227129_1